MNDSRLPTPPVGGVLTVVPWHDPVVDPLGHDPRSVYVERFWLGVLGPSAIWLLRHAAHRFDDDPAGFDLELVPAAQSLGLSYAGGRNSPFWRTVTRCVQFGVARDLDGTFAVRRRLPPLTQRQLARLPDPARADHHQWTRRARRRTHDGPLPLERAKLLATTLVELGEPYHEIRRQLRSWRVPAPMATAVTDWAFEADAATATSPARTGPGPG